jgi:lysophospholipase L1-like esterase
VRGCSRPNLGGTFGFWFAQDSAGKYRSKIDFHQIGSGWGDHFWFSHTWNHPQNAHEVKGIWTPNLPADARWYRVLAHLPDHGAHTRTARYEVKIADGTTRSRVVNQFSQGKRGNWAHVGSFQLKQGSSVSLTNLYNKGDGTWDVAWDAMAFIPLTGKPYTYVALGDSYSSGEGNEPYDHNSHFDWHGDADRCHRSASAYPRLVTHAGLRIAEHSNGTEPYEFHFEACAGATTVAMTDAAIDGPGEHENDSTPWGAEEWRSGEEQQLERGFLDENTDLVTITMGGNDVSYSSVLRSCALRNDCLAADFHAERNGEVDPAPLIDYQPYVIGEAVTKLRKTYEEIARRAPNARIVVLGYPTLWAPLADRVPRCTENYGLMLDSHINWFNDMAVLLENDVAGVVQSLRNAGTNIRYVSLNPAFVGHRLCERLGIRWFHDFELTNISFPGAMHPNVEGQAAFAGRAQTGKDMP